MRSVFLQRNKAVFDVTKLPTDEYAASLGLLSAPKVKVVEVRDITMIVAWYMTPRPDRGCAVLLPQRAKQLKNQPRKAVALKNAAPAAANKDGDDDDDDDDDEGDEDVAVASDDDSDGAAAEDDSSDEDEDEDGSAREARAATGGDDAAPHRNPVRRRPAALAALLPESLTDVRVAIAGNTQTSRTSKKMAKVFNRKNQDLLTSHYGQLRAGNSPFDVGGADETAEAAASDDVDDLLVVKRRHNVDDDDASSDPERQVCAACEALLRSLSRSLWLTVANCDWNELGTGPAVAQEGRAGQQEKVPGQGRAAADQGGLRRGRRGTFACTHSRRRRTQHHSLLTDARVHCGVLRLGRHTTFTSLTTTGACPSSSWQRPRRSARQSPRRPASFKCSLVSLPRRYAHT